MPDETLDKLRSHPLTLKEIGTNFTAVSWLKSPPEPMLDEIAATLVRQDTEPKFFTWYSFANMGHQAFRKYTEADFTSQIDLNEKG